MLAHTHICICVYIYMQFHYFLYGYFLLLNISVPGFLHRLSATSLFLLNKCHIGLYLGRSPCSDESCVKKGRLSVGNDVSDLKNYSLNCGWKYSWILKNHGLLAKNMSYLSLSMNGFLEESTFLTRIHDDLNTYIIWNSLALNYNMQDSDFHEG